MFSLRLAAYAILVAGLGLLAGPVQAQSIEDKLRAQLRTVTAELNDLQNSQQTLQAAKDAAEHERDGFKAKLAAGRGAQGGAPAASAAALAQAKAEIAQLTQANTAAQAEIAKYKDAYTKVVDSSQQVHGERDRFAEETAARTQELADCETKNITLVKIGRDVLSAYTRIGVVDALERGEPFIGLKRVKMERIAQDYGDKVYEAKFDPRMVKPAKAAAASPAPAGSTTASTPAPAAAAPPADANP